MNSTMVTDAELKQRLAKKLFLNLSSVLEYSFLEYTSFKKVKFVYQKPFCINIHPLDNNNFKQGVLHSILSFSPPSSSFLMRRGGGGEVKKFDYNMPNKFIKYFRSVTRRVSGLFVTVAISVIADTADYSNLTTTRFKICGTVFR